MYMYLDDKEDDICEYSPPDEVADIADHTRYNCYQTDKEKTKYNASIARYHEQERKRKRERERERESHTT